MPNNWKKYKLGEIVVQPRDITYGVVQPGKASIDGIPIVKVNNITSKDFSKSNMEKVTKEIEEKYTRSRLQGNEILISLVGSLGYLCKVEKGMIGWNVARAVGVLPIKEEFNRDWIFFYLRGPQAQHELKTIATTSVQATINLKDLKGLEIPYPSISEIDSITEILSSLDDKIELNLQTNKTLEEMANALYKHWFVDFGPFKDGKFVESELGMIPEGWEVANLGDVVDIGSSKRIFLNEYVSSGIPFYRGKEIIELSKNNSINTELFIENEKFEEIKVKFGAPKEGDILLTSVGTIGKSYLVGANETFYFKDGNLTWIKNYISYLKPHFIFQWLNSNETFEQIQSIKIGSTQEAITIQGIRGLKIVVPPKLVHDQVEISIREYRNLIKANNLENETIRQTRDYLLPKLISGEIRVKETANSVKQLI